MSPTPSAHLAERSTDSDLTLLRRLWRYVRPDWWTVAIALLLTPAIAGLSLAQPALLKSAIDDHIVPQQLDGLLEEADEARLGEGVRLAHVRL